jgi:diguanylate cyclase (GGDEF)-like protein
MREDAYRIAELTYRKEVDSATRLYNKNKYEDMLANYYTMVERVAVVLWDINNLKEINDRMGHGMGDKLIETMSGAIYAQTDSRKKAYQLGETLSGTLLRNDELKHKETLKERLEHAQVKAASLAGREYCISFSVGYADSLTTPFPLLYKVADKAMYQQKQFYYEHKRMQDKSLEQ